MTHSNQLIGLLPLAIGLAVLILARSIQRVTVRMAEWQLKVMRRPGFAWYYRIFGGFFALSGLIMIFFPVS